MEKCGSCGLKHEQVEAHGIWYCPNALCLGVGGAWFRDKLESCKYHSDGTHTIDEDEWLEKGIEYNKEHKINRKRFFRSKSK